VYRGVKKRQLDKKLILERKTLDMQHVLTLDDEKCVGCGICKAICPEQSPKLSSAVTQDGRLMKKPGVDFEANRCTFCGECVDLCPTNAIKIEINGELRVPVFEVEAFPVLKKIIAMDAKKCWYGAITADCDAKCQEECPTDAIEVTIEKTEEESEGRIVDFKVLEEECIFCKKCEKACPEDAIYVINPVRGSLQLDTSLCPEGCRICVDICPSEAILIDEGKKLVVNEEFCIYCGACQQVCPEKAIKVDRTQVLHTDVQSGAWVEALEKLTSYRSVIREMSFRSVKKRRDRVKSLAAE
jgi:4Fe-4S ferredoxin